MKLVYRCILIAVEIPVGARDCLFSTFVQIGSQNNTPSYSVATVHPSFSLGLKRPGIYKVIQKFNFVSLYVKIRIGDSNDK